MNKRSEQPTELFVKNLLGDPDSPELVFDTLTEMQRVGLSIVRLAQDNTQGHADIMRQLDALRKEGCDRYPGVEGRVDRLERWYWKCVGGAAALSLIAIAIGIWQALK